MHILMFQIYVHPWSDSQFIAETYIVFALSILVFCTSQLSVILDDIGVLLCSVYNNLNEPPVSFPILGCR